MDSYYSDLMGRYEEISVASSIKGVLEWDIETGKMPAMGFDHRSKQLAYLTQKIQDFWKSETTGKLIEQSRALDLNPIEKRNLELIKRDFDTRTKIPTELVLDRVRQANKTNEIWKKAKHRTSFELVQAELEKLFNLNLTYARQLAELKGLDNPYDALIDERDEGLRSNQISTYFNEVRSFLSDFIKKHGAKEQNEAGIQNIHLTREEKVGLSQEIAGLYQYIISGDNARGSIDEVEHPLTITCGPDDVRITVNYSNYIDVITATHHELGHGMDHLGRNPSWIYTPINDFSGPTLSECNSRYTENKIGKSIEFYVNFFPIMNEIGDYRFNEFNVDDFYNVLTEIKPGMSRMSADEVTYGLHIIIRFEMEQMLFSDKMTVSEIPQVWNEKYENYLGVTVENDTFGAMQDLHWYSVYWGYFHGYFMGDLLGAQFHASMESEINEWRDNLIEGDLRPVLGWQRENIYSKGALFTPLELVKEVTGNPLNTKYFKDYIKAKYQNL